VKRRARVGQQRSEWPQLNESVMTTGGRPLPVVRRPSPGGVFALLFVIAFSAPGCCVIGAAAAHRSEIKRDRATRGNVGLLNTMTRGTMVTVKQAGAPAVTGKFLGCSVAGTSDAEPLGGGGDELLHLRVGRRSVAIRTEHVEWVELKSSPHVVLAGFGVGLAVDLFVLYRLFLPLSGLGGYGTLR